MTAIDETSPIQVVAVSVPPRTWRSDWRAIKVVWRREIIRFRRDRLRMITSLMQPLLFLFVLGTGLSSLFSGTDAGEINVRTFLFPGVLTLAVLFTAVFSAGSIVWDREFGFLREMLVAPVGRWAIVVGKVVGGATVATFQGLLLLALAGLVGVPYNPLMMLLVLLRAHHRRRDPGAHAADVLLVWCAIPAEQPACLVDDPHAYQPIDLRG